MIQLVWIVPIRTAETPAGDFAGWVEEQVPESETVWVAVEDHWNELATIQRSLKGRSLAPADGAGGWILEEVPDNRSQAAWRLKTQIARGRKLAGVVPQVAVEVWVEGGAVGVLGGPTAD